MDEKLEKIFAVIVNGVLEELFQTRKRAQVFLRNEALEVIENLRTELLNANIEDLFDNNNISKRISNMAETLELMINKSSIQPFEDHRDEDEQL